MSGIISSAGSKSGVIGETEKDHKSPSGTHGGTIVQTKVTSSGDVDSGTDYTAWDDTLPPIGEGVIWMQVTITPKHVSNILHVYAQIILGANHGLDYAIAGVYEGSNHLGSSWTSGVGEWNGEQVSVHGQMVAGSTSALTFSVTGASKQAGIVYLNGDEGTRYLGGGAYSFIRVTEHTRPA